jgi:hypothetical protein
MGLAGAAAAIRISSVLVERFMRFSFACFG